MVVLHKCLLILNSFSWNSLNSQISHWGSMSSAGEAALSSFSFPAPKLPSSGRGRSVCLRMAQLVLCDLKNVNHSTRTSAKENISVDIGERVGWK